MRETKRREIRPAPSFLRERHRLTEVPGPGGTAEPSLFPLHRLPAPPPASSPLLSCLLTHFAGGAPNEPQPLFADIFCNWTSRPFHPLLCHPELVQNLHVFDPYVSSG